MRRITVDEVKEACEKTGYRLQPGLVIDDGWRCGCPIGLVARAGGYDGPSMGSSEALGLDNCYAGGVMNGFDDYSPPMIATERYRVGHADGTAIRQALLPSS